jgi:hypothetical protein
LDVEAQVKGLTSSDDLVDDKGGNDTACHDEVPASFQKMDGRLSHDRYLHFMVVV